MEDPPLLKRKITLKLPGGAPGAANGPSTPTATAQGPLPPPATSPAPDTPSGEGGTRIKLNVARKPLPSAAPDAPASTIISAPPAAIPRGGATAKPKASRATKPTAMKRAKDESRDGNVGHATARNGRPAAGPAAKRIKVLKTPALSRPPTLKLKNTGKAPYRPPGDGYDSEAEDREVDPVIEEQFILRMPPGEHCDYIRRAIQERKIGLPPKAGGADLSMKWVDDDGRRCMITVRGQSFAAVLVDLPTITEGMKTWDKKTLVKSADICQMLLVFEKVDNEGEARRVKLPKVVEQGYRWPHGLTPPMHDCIHRRFRKRLSKLEIQNKEAEVERLLKADKEAASTRWEFVDERQRSSVIREDMQYEEEEEEEEEEEMEEEGEADAEGEAEDYFGDAGMADAHDFVDDALLEAEFEAQFSDAMVESTEAATPAAGGGLEVATPMTANAATPAADVSAMEDDDDDDEDDDDDDDESEEDAGDENGNIDDGDDEDGARHDELAAVRNEIAQLRKQLTDLEGQLARSTATIMKRRIEHNIKNLKVELELKRSSIGETHDD